MEVQAKNKPQISARRFPIGAEVLTSGGVHFRVWAPKCRRVMLVLEGDSPGNSS
jgi:1,4-alpha-glucan branching enzyme